jgi:SPP1 family predicted phage head-tail adaptor
MKVIVEYVEDEADGRGPSGGVKKIPVVVFRGPAELRPLSMRELLAGGGITAEITHRLSLRYRPEVKPTGRFKLVGTDRLFEISSVINVEERNRELVCLVIEKGG